MSDRSIVLPCRDLDACLAFYVGELGFRLEQVFPADAPRVAVLSGSGLTLRLERAAAGGAGSPATGFVLQRAAQGDFAAGRAGMLYRDLLPGRQGGRCIASHIRIPAGGPVPDYVHRHDVRFQVIYCHRGRVRVVYEDQGAPFTLEAGDCVLQPPYIAHRVLECSDGLEVIEFASPAEHVTFVEHDVALPTGRVDPSRDFSGQRFVHHRAAGAAWRPWRLPGFLARDTGIGAASAGRGSVTVARPAAPPADGYAVHEADTVFQFVLRGSVTLDRLPGRRPASSRLEQADAIALPPGQPYRYRDPSPDLELLDVTMPGDTRTRAVAPRAGQPAPGVQPRSRSTSTTPIATGAR